MARKLKGKLGNGKGLRGALTRHELMEQSKKKLSKAANSQKEQQLLKERSIKAGGANKYGKKQQQNHQKGLIPFGQGDSVLLVGEGDFSFAVSIIKERLIHPENLVATSYDSKDDLIAKYPDVEENLSFLRGEGVKILHEIDATNLAGTLKLAPKGKNKTSKGLNNLFTSKTHLDYIMFNFPHTGKGVKDVDRNIRDHQKLVLNYFKSCKEVFKLVNDESKNDFAGYSTNSVNNGKIILSLFEGEPYHSWNIKILGRSENFKVECSGKFDWQMFPHYHHRRTNGIRDTTKPAAERDARIYIFEPFEKTIVEDNHIKKRDLGSGSDPEDD